MKIRSLTAGLALLATGTVIGVTTQQFASADVSSGDRPVLVPIETCRLVDTRENPEFNVGPRTTPLGREETLTVDAQQPGTDCTGLISTDASALSLNVTAPTATEESFITIWADGPRPDASSLNPQPGQLVFNAVTVDLAADQTFRIFNNRGNTNIIVDVNGYYENHDHDDRYYTQTEVDAAVGTKANTADLPEIYYAVVNGNDPAAITRSSPGVTLQHGGAGSSYFFTFPRNVTTCFWSATLGGDSVLGNAIPVTQDLGITATQGTQGILQVDPDEVAVAVYNPVNDFVVAPFTLTVTCP